MRKTTTWMGLLLTVWLATAASAQRPHQPSSAEIYQGIKKLNVLGNVLYLAAHPDDENTRFIAYAANELLYNTAYLSLTRGDGGQNLIGPELREELGIIRTQELLAARRIDGGIQYFSRANDFGYSKTAEETLEIWDKDKVLSDTVRVIREFRPDVIVCRFPIDGGGGHGHHTASAMLGLEAFHLAADEAAYPEQLGPLQPWQAKRIVVNTGRWWNPDISADDPGVVALDVGAYNKLLGTSCGEIAARSRTMHKSQGFGATGTRGEQMEYFEHLAGEPAQESLFDGIDTGWTRLGLPEEQAEWLQASGREVMESFDFEAPEQSLSRLLAMRNLLRNLGNEFWMDRKWKEVDRLIQACAGLYVEAIAEDYWAAPGETVSVQIEVVARSGGEIQWSGLEVLGTKAAEQVQERLPANQRLERVLSFPVSATMAQEGPYWLKETGTLGTYRVDDPELIGTPENEPDVSIALTFQMEGQNLTIEVPVAYKWNDPVHGERWRPFVVCPPVFVNFQEPSQIFAGPSSKPVALTVKAVEPGFQGRLELDCPEGWSLHPSSFPLSFTSKGEEQTVVVTVTATEAAQPFDLRARVVRGEEVYDRSLREIDYDHIPTQIHMPVAQSRMVFVELARKGQRIGYVPGAGDTIPEALRNVGYTVDGLQEADLTTENLARYDAIITGIRLLNVDERIGFSMPKLLEYCENGGTLVLQYNTRHALKTDTFSPFPITLSRDRVTEEDAEVRFLQPDHPVLNTPNQLTQADFDGWVQERGLYFPSEWAPEYDAVLSWNDQGESPKDGSLLVAKYGKGHYVYTGISFFRELPAGVPGAYRLLVNLLSLGHE